MEDTAGSDQPEGIELAPAASSPGAFARFYQEQFARMAQLAYLLTGARDESRDIAQDAFVALHRRFDRVIDPAAYVRRSVVNGCHSYHRRRGRRASRVDRMDDSVDLGARELVDALARLSRQQRAALVLRYFHDLPDTEIARVLGCQPGTVASLVHRGLARLREVIEP